MPPNARLQLQRIDNVTYAPLDLVPLVTLPRGYAGLLYMTTLATQTTPAGNNYIEGCWHLFPSANATWPGVVLGTGVEDYFDSAYWFCALGGQVGTIGAASDSFAYNIFESHHVRPPSLLFAGGVSLRAPFVGSAALLPHGCQRLGCHR